MSEIIKEMEKRVLEHAALLNETKRYLDALTVASRKIFKNKAQATIFNEGLDLMYHALYNQSCENITDCFVLVGVGGEEVQKYCTEMSKELMKGDEEGMLDFLKRFGTLPRGHR